MPAASPASSLILLLTFLVLFSRSASVSPTENFKNCRAGALEAVVGWDLKLPA